MLFSFLLSCQFSPLLLSSNRKCRLVPVIGRTFKPDHLLTLSLPSVYILGRLLGSVWPHSLFHQVSYAFRCHRLLGISKFMSPDQIFLMCSGFRYSATFLLPRLGYHTGSLNIVLIFPIYTRDPKLFLSQSAISQKMLTTILKAAQVKLTPSIHLKLCFVFILKLISSVTHLLFYSLPPLSHIFLIAFFHFCYLEFISYTIARLIF